MCDTVMMADMSVFCWLVLAITWVLVKYKASRHAVLCCCRPDGQKKAYVRLTADYDALDVANKIGII